VDGLIMSIFDTNKIFILYNDTYQDSNKIGKLDNDKLYVKQIEWMYKSESVNLLINSFSSSLNTSFYLGNISEEILKNVKILVYISNGLNKINNGFSFNGAFSGLFDYHFLMTSDITAKLYVKCSASALTDKNLLIPIHWNIKLIFKPLLHIITT
jgi:hypothetical protein